MPLSAFTAPCRAEDGCAPELSPLVVTTARFTNAAGHVLLAGPVDLVRGSGFAGRGRRGVRRRRRGGAAGVRQRGHLPGRPPPRGEPRHRGLTGINQRTVITRRVRLFVSRLDAPDGGAEQEVVVRERVPVSEVSAVEVRVRRGLVPAPDEVDAEGIARYALRLARANGARSPSSTTSRRPAPSPGL